MKKKIFLYASFLVILYLVFNLGGVIGYSQAVVLTQENDRVGKIYFYHELVDESPEIINSELVRRDISSLLRDYDNSLSTNRAHSDYFMKLTICLLTDVPYSEDDSYKIKEIPRFVIDRLETMVDSN